MPTTDQTTQRVTQNGAAFLLSAATARPLACRVPCTRGVLQLPLYSQRPYPRCPMHMAGAAPLCVSTRGNVGDVLMQLCVQQPATNTVHCPTPLQRTRCAKRPRRRSKRPFLVSAWGQVGLCRVQDLCWASFVYHWQYVPVI